MAVNVLSNKYVNYVLLIIAIANLLGYLAMEDYESLTLFVAIYALSTYFSKNTTVNLSAAILGTAIVRTPNRGKAWPWREREGFEGQEGAGMVTPYAIKALEKTDKTLNHEGLTSKGPAPATEEEEEVSGKNLMSLGKNLGKQFQDMSASLGKNGIKGLMNETKDLSKTQEALMEQMATMAPLMENAEKLLKTFESTGMMKMVDRVLPFVEKIALPGTGAAK